VAFIHKASIAITASGWTRSMADSAPKIAEEERFESPDVVDRKAQRLVDQIKKSKHFLAVTGAGVSTSAGQFQYKE
jgi:hypothetical protein